MKKKLFLILSIVLVAIMACSMLVACVDPDENGGDINQEGEEINKVSIAESPTEFFNNWKADNNRSFAMAQGDDTESFAMSGGTIAKTEGGPYVHYYEITEKNKLNVYLYDKENKEWERQAYSTLEDIKLEFSIDVDELTNTAPFLGDYPEYIIKTLNLEYFEANCTKTENTYVGKISADQEEPITIVITAKDLSFNMGEVKVTFGLNNDKIVIPQEAKTAPDTTRDRTIQKALTRFVAKENIEIVEVSGSYKSTYAINGNIIKKEISNNHTGDYVIYEAMYIEQTADDAFVLYYYHADDTREWSAKTLTKQELLASDEIKNLHITKFTDLKDLFNQIARGSKVYDSGNIDEYFTKVADNVYQSDLYQFEGDTLTISDTQIVFENPEREEKETTKISEKITIPEEAKAALQ